MTVRDMLTEAEAANRWCPMGKETVDPLQSVEHRIDGTITTKASDSCISSRCMFWRWSHQDHDGTPTGFCGGAGTPKYM